MGGKKINLNIMKRGLRTFYLDNKRMPSFSEFAQTFGYKSKGAVRYTVDKLVEEGIVEKDQKGKLLPKNLNEFYPILGSIAAGFPSPAEEELQDTISFDEYLVDNPEATFLVSVTGDSMIDAGIHPGDIVVVERGKIAKNGNIVIAEVDDEWTMKYLEMRNGKPFLVAANKKYPPIEPKEELKIGGVVAAVIRKY